jgi:DNA topoisomerase I
VTDHLEGIDARDVNSIAIPGSDVVVRVGRYGPYLERGEQRASLPDDLAPDELTHARAEELLAQPAGAERGLGKHPETGREIAAKDGRYGPYVTEVLAEGEDGKPRTASLFSSMSLDTITLDDAVRLLTLPRTLEGTGGEEILVANGRYGPFVKKGTETRSLESEEQLLTLTVEQAEAILAQPKQRRGRGAPKPPLKELGADPASGKPIVVRDGRFGPYVTDGETNASLRRGDTPEAITLERAVELLTERRAKSA